MKRFFLVIALILIISGAYYVGIQKGSKIPQDEKSAIEPTIESEDDMVVTEEIPSETPEITQSSQQDETINWKTYSSDILFFKYPADFTLEERQKNFIVLLSDANNPQSVFVSVDARFSEDYENYEKAVSSAEARLTDVQTQGLTRGIKISGKIGPGYAQGQPITMALFKYGDAAVKLETTATDPTQLHIFDKILSTFTFNE